MIAPTEIDTRDGHPGDGTNAPGLADDGTIGSRRNRGRDPSAGVGDDGAGAGLGSDDRLATALAGGATVAGAARAAGISERTAYRRLDEPGFRARVNDARATLVEHALARMAGSMTDAADTLRVLLSAERETVRLGAARSILELGTRLREAVEIERRINDLEVNAAQRIEQLEQQAARQEGRAWQRD